MGHGKRLFDDELGIPLAARFPGIVAGGDLLECPVGLIDIMPTLCSYLGVECPTPMSGESWIRAEGEDVRIERYLIGEGLPFAPKSRAVRDGTHKLIWEPDQQSKLKKWHADYRLYNLRDDPGETNDLLDQSPRSPELEAIFERLAHALQQGPAPYDTPKGEKVPLDPAQIERLKALGYLE